MAPRPTRRQKEHIRDRNKANQLTIIVFWHHGPQEDRKSAEETETKQINLYKLRVFGHQGPQEDRKSTEETEAKQTNLR